VKNGWFRIENSEKMYGLEFKTVKKLAV